MEKAKDQLHTDNYSIYNADCMSVLPTLEKESIDLSVYSPPFFFFFYYKSDHRVLSCCGTRDVFLSP